MISNRTFALVGKNIWWRIQISCRGGHAGDPPYISWFSLLSI